MKILFCYDSPTELWLLTILLVLCIKLLHTNQLLFRTSIDVINKIFKECLLSVSYLNLWYSYLCLFWDFYYAAKVKETDDKYQHKTGLWKISSSFIQLWIASWYFCKIYLELLWIFMKNVVYTEKHLVMPQTVIFQICCICRAKDFMFI